MKLLLNVISAFVYFCTVTPVLMYYIYEENPSGGFVSLDHDVGYGNVGLSSLQRKHFSSPKKFHKVDRSEHVVDSHFHVTKTDLKISRLPVENRRQESKEAHTYPETPKKTEQMKKNNDRGEENARQDNRKNKQDNGRNNGEERKDFHHVNKDKKQNHISNKQANINHHKKNEYINPHSYNAVRPKFQRESLENKPNLVELNVRKTQITSDPQKVVRVNNNRQMIAMPEHGAITRAGYQRVAPSPIVDKTLHKTTFSERNSQIMARVLNDMAYKIPDKRIKGEHLKRDTNNTPMEEVKSKRNVMSDTMRKYIGKDKNMVRDQNKRVEVPRIGGLQEKIDDTPYALFYRMNPQTLDQQDDFMVISNNENSENDFSVNGKPLTVGYDNDVYVGKTKSNSNVKRNKKLKNFSSFHV